jgi:hypothetical protein
MDKGHEVNVAYEGQKYVAFHVTQNVKKNCVNYSGLLSTRNDILCAEI